MTDSEPGAAPPGPLGPLGPPARPPGAVPAGYVHPAWLQQAPPPPGPPLFVSPAPPPPLPPPPPGVAGADVPFLDTPWVPPQTKRQGWMWLVYAVVGFLVGQIGALIFGYAAGSVAGKTGAQMQAIATAATPPEWYVVATLLGLWIGFVGAPWLASRTQGTRNFVRDLGLRFRPIDVLGIAIGLGGQLVVVLMYAPFQHDIHDFNGPSQRLTGGSHGGGFVIIAIATVVFAPAMEELFFRGLLLKGLVRLFTPQRAVGGARTVGVVLAVLADGLLFGLAHGEWVQLAGLAVFGAILATVSYRTGRLGMNTVAHATFNLVAIIAIAFNGSGVVH
jgi:membrane protease YdiL (CAAX protease family)